MNISIVGCGGIGQWLVPAVLSTAAKGDTVQLIDPDRVEEKNLARQINFKRANIGTHKAKVLAKEFGRLCPNILPITKPVAPEMLAGSGAVFLAVDNHTARQEVLAWHKRTVNTILIDCANERISASAWVMLSEWHGTPLDICSQFPDIMTPVKKAAPTALSCGQAAATSPQTVYANKMASTLGFWLYLFWTTQAPFMLDPLARPTFPIRYRATVGRINTVTIGDVENVRS